MYFYSEVFGTMFYSDFVGNCNCTELVASFNCGTPDKSFTMICNINNMCMYSYILLSCFINVGVKVAFTNDDSCSFELLLPIHCYKRMFVDINVQVLRVTIFL